MNQFSQFNIKSQLTTLSGEKIKIDKVLNVPIEVHRYKIEDSTAKTGTKYLQMQIRVKDEMRVLFTGSVNLQQMIQRVPDNGFPFTTTIIKQDERYDFT